MLAPGGYDIEISQLNHACGSQFTSHLLSSNIHFHVKQNIKQNTPTAMDLLDELDNMAISAAYEDPEDNEDDPSKATIKMWQERFGYSYEQAADLVRITKTIKQPSSENQPLALSPTQARTIYALRLDKPLSTPQDVQLAANIPRVPEVYYGTGEEGGAEMFWKVDGTAKVSIKNRTGVTKRVGLRPSLVVAWYVLTPEVRK